MGVDNHPRIPDERVVRFVFASIATLIGIATIAIRSTDAVDYSLIVPTIVAYWAWAVLEKFPRAVLYLLGLSVPLVLNIVESDTEVSLFLLITTAAVVAALEPVRGAVVAILVTVMTLILIFGLTGAISEFAFANWLFGVGFTWGFGEFAYRYGTTIEELEQTRSLVADQAALRERRRIARDVHDLVGHSLSVVMLHVTGARHLVHKDPGEAERALEQAEAAGRESLAEIRRTVAMLREDGDSVEPPVPSPDLADVGGLVNEYFLGGIDITYDVIGDVARVDAAAALAGYRIIQEALTNASRHTLDAKVVVTLDVGDRTYDLTVQNSAGVSMDRGKGSGFGLVSMRERAKSVGGLLVAGPTPDGWVVQATLPVNSVDVGASSA